MFNFFKKNKPNIQEEWNSKGEQYTSAINKMVEFGKKMVGKTGKEKNHRTKETIWRMKSLVSLERQIESKKLTYSEKVFHLLTNHSYHFWKNKGKA